MASLCAHDATPMTILVALLAVLTVHVNTGARAANIADSSLTVPIFTWTACREGQGHCSEDSGSGQDGDALYSNVAGTALCPSGYYGGTCTDPCSANCVNSTCTQDTGNCTNGCLPGFIGANCTKVKDRKLCPKGFYGDNCKSPCSANCVNGTCNQDTGKCTHGCLPGFIGAKCIKGCPAGKYGAGCSERCPRRCRGGRCDHRTGVCSAGCKGNYWGSDCSLVKDRKLCPKGFNGDNCTSPCSANCVNGTCNQDTGKCTQGCLPGFIGAKCIKGCPAGKYGAGCSERCPRRCRGGRCDHRTGVCSAGCKGDYWGSDCSLGVDMRRNSRKDRLQFYRQLSAEGKSVLLYLLASRYEHALARAQLEVDQALQDRNDIRHFMKSPGKATS